ncbi:MULTISPECIES: hypothetical protein [unclassified Marinobacter]|uniref:hypothetical protein n=1 Tax=unclassified Marinobacter TaxID=83889 RepID=UPI00126957F1|nr:MULTISPECIES: hypothetical protein [unclassified Marinobacter]QFS87618.1 hypothetical protein FIV08_12365 [Marinobacter sp. THAF197a]QFT51403.1 hypothetical protein FIU96_12280 [Marinobacter sp. THAF39]
MEVIYQRDIAHELQQTIHYARANNDTIQEIRLTEEEWDMLRAQLEGLAQSHMHPSSYAMKKVEGEFMGVRLRVIKK